jgi:hypothetical protein
VPRRPEERLAPRLEALRPAPRVRCPTERLAEVMPRAAVREAAAAPRVAVRAAEAAPRVAVRAAPRALEAPVRRPRALVEREREAPRGDEERDFDPRDAVERRAPDDERAPDDVRDRDEDREREDDRDLDALPDDGVPAVDGDAVPRPTGIALTAFFAISAMVPAALVTTEPTVLAAVPTPEATVSRTPLVLSSAIVPPRRRMPSHPTLAPRAPRGHGMASFAVARAR